MKVYCPECSREAEDALDRLAEDRDTSYRGLAKDMQCSRTSLSKLYQDEGRRRWFLDREAEDERVQQALDEISETE